MNIHDQRATLYHKQITTTGHALKKLNLIKLKHFRKSFKKMGVIGAPFRFSWLHIFSLVGFFFFFSFPFRALHKQNILTVLPSWGKKCWWCWKFRFSNETQLELLIFAALGMCVRGAKSSPGCLWRWHLGGTRDRAGWASAHRVLGYQELLGELEMKIAFFKKKKKSVPRWVLRIKMENPSG